MSVFSRLLKESFKLDCPACHKSKLFKAMFKIEDECQNCNFNFRQSDVADGPVYIVLCIMLFVFAPALIIFEIKYEPSLLVHLLVSLPLFSSLSIYFYRVSKSFMIRHEYLVGRG